MFKKTKQIIKPINPQAKGKTPIKYSKAVREQLLVSDLATALVMMYQQAIKTNDPEILSQLNKIKTNLNQIQQSLYGGGIVVFHSKDHTNYKSTLKQIQAILDSVYQNSTIIHAGFIAGIIAIVDDMNQIISKLSRKNDYINSWNQLTINLQKLYEIYDPEIQNDQFNNEGSKLASQINKIIKEN